MKKYNVTVFYENKWITYYRHVYADSIKDAKSKVRGQLMVDGWEFVNADALVMEVERVYATRYDCIFTPERVRLAA